jgi:carbamoyltransferase
LHSGFEKVFIQPAANDAGTAIGAAYLLAKEAQNTPTAHYHNNQNIAYLGTEYCKNDILTALEQSNTKYNYNYKEQPQLVEQVAKLLAQGKVIGWFQGRVEFGPRALGNRSILADPRYFESKDKIDTHIKFRDSFRPYAPSVLIEQACQWFDFPTAAKPSANHMLVAAQVWPQKANAIEGVIHRDGSSRIHLVTAQSNPLYHALISQFYRLTGVPMLLNTSFNSCEPIVESPAQALATFNKTALEVLVIGGFIVEKSTQQAPASDVQILEKTGSVEI